VAVAVTTVLTPTRPLAGASATTGPIWNVARATAWLVSPTATTLYMPNGLSGVV
jgi:hypothetical protein